MEPQRDLNIKLICPHCKNPVPNIIENFRDGDLICGDCGLILGDRVVDTRSEWRTFADSEGDDPSRVGAAADTLLGDANTLEATTISRKDGGTGRAKDISRIHGKLADSRKSNSLMEMAKKINSTCDKFGLEKTVIDSAIQLYKSSQTSSQLKSVNPDWVMAACIYLACKLNHVTRTFKEICGVTNVPKKEIGKLYKLLQAHFKKETKEKGGSTAHIQVETGVEGFIRRFTGDLDLAKNVQSACVQVRRSFMMHGVSNVWEVLRGENAPVRRVFARLGAVGNRVFERGILTGKSTISLVASAIYFVVCLSDTPKTAIEIAQVSGCTEPTLKNAYRTLYQHRESLIEGITTAKGLEALPI
ncbi:transcription initiation factor IIB [Podochytrium sp. JEL0797]|nr:transcription initiation factor IIB [Podochytrium sp. JEL0797]